MSASWDDDPAGAALEELVARLGLGFNPDYPVADYVTVYTDDGDLPWRDGEEVGPTFSPEEAARLQEGLDLAFLVHGEEGVHAIVFALEPWKSAFPDGP